MNRTRTVAAALAVALVAVAGCSDDDSSNADEPAGTTTTTEAETTTTTTAPAYEVPAAVFSGPVEGGSGIPANGAEPELLALNGYIEDEWFATGTATSFEVVGEAGEDGKWDAEPTDDEGDYVTRILVRKPTDPATFSGTVVVEWNNVTVGADATTEWAFLSEEIMRQGHVYVGVSAQEVGVQGRPDGEEGGLGVPAVGIKGGDPVRYATLSHPGDAYALDLYSQIAAGLREPVGVDVLDGLEPEHVIAMGESQSAFFLTSYVNAVHPVSHVYDGFLIHARGGGAAALDGERDPGGGLEGGVQIRDDVEEPVLVFESETDMIELGYANARQAQTESFRAWEVAGTAHADSALLGSPEIGEALGCGGLINDGPQDLVLRAAMRNLVTWVADGTPPPDTAELDLSSEDPPTLARDADGNATGGIRTPHVDVPWAALSGAPSAETFLCFLSGSTVLFPPDDMAARYGDRDAYLTQFAAALDEAIDAGVVLEDDRALALQDAEAADFGG